MYIVYICVQPRDRSVRIPSLVDAGMEGCSNQRRINGMSADRAINDHCTLSPVSLLTISVVHIPRQ